jgi:hypothetical protein
MGKAGWWQRSVEMSPPSAAPSVTPPGASSSVSRRQALEGILVACGVVAVAAHAPDAHAQQPPFGPPPPVPPPDPSEDVRTDARVLLAMQKQFGWSFGAATENLVFDGASVLPFDPRMLARMADDLRPARRRHQPFYVSTLFQSPASLPHAVPAGDPAVVVPLERALRPILTPAMQKAYKRGRALASLFRLVYARAAVVVDLPGPEAVAFAAGAAHVLDPVFDNWPPPRGVVPAHLTLAAAAYYQPLFARHAAPAGAPPLFVLDRSRLAPYTDDEAGFDNRHVAHLPSAEALRGMDIGHVLYVTPTSADALELDDLNEDFVHYAATGLIVKTVAADAFSRDGEADPAARAATSSPGIVPPFSPPGQGPWGQGPWGQGPAMYAPVAPLPALNDDERTHYYYGGSASTNLFFWIDYPWTQGVHDGGRIPREPRFSRPGAGYFPVARVSPHSRGILDAATLRAHGVLALPPYRPSPTGFGQVRVVISNVSGVVLGAVASRSGTWARASGGTGA